MFKWAMAWACKMTIEYCVSDIVTLVGYAIPVLDR
jgi:hypothetical protein